jgi:hypothetical protein
VPVIALRVVRGRTLTGQRQGKLPSSHANNPDTMSCKLENEEPDGDVILCEDMRQIMSSDSYAKWRSPQTYCTANFRRTTYFRMIPLPKVDVQ